MHSTSNLWIISPAALVLQPRRRILASPPRVVRRKPLALPLLLHGRVCAELDELFDELYRLLPHRNQSAIHMRRLGICEPGNEHVKVGGTIVTQPQRIGPPPKEGH